MAKIFFQSSMPRAGSTLLQNIMGQNPDFYVTPTSGLMELIYGARKNFSESTEFKHHLEPELMSKGFSAFCDKGIHAFVNATTDKKYYLDKGRSWGYYYNWLKSFMPYQPKIICMVRDLRDIFASMEKAFRKDPNREYLLNWGQGMNTTLPKRIDFWCANPPVGIAIDRIEAIFQMNYAENFLFIKYEDLCLRPEIEIKRIYDYLDIPFFQHNFDFIPQITHEDDSVHDGFGDHIIRNKLEMLQSNALQLLGLPVCNWIYDRYKWYFDVFKYKK